MTRHRSGFSAVRFLARGPVRQSILLLAALMAIATANAPAQSGARTVAASSVEPYAAPTLR